jgi:hypothetical protein
LRVVTLANRVTILKAFPDRGVQTVKLSYFADIDSLNGRDGRCLEFAARDGDACEKAPR